MSTSRRQELLQTAHTVIKSYNTWDIDAILAPRSSTCIHQILPTSLRIPPLNNPAYRTYFAPFLLALRNWNLSVKDEHTTIDEEARKVSMWATSSADTDLGMYETEYWLTLQMTEDGQEVERVWEWVDSGYSRDFLSRLRQHLTDQTKQEKAVLRPHEKL